MEQGKGIVSNVVDAMKGQPILLAVLLLNLLFLGFTHIDQKAQAEAQASAQQQRMAAVMEIVNRCLPD